MIAKERASVRLPVGVAFETAATVWHNYGTAYYALVEGARAQHGETVFITGAAGGVGLAAVDLAGRLGLRVIAGVGSDDKAALVRGYGAFDVINYRSEDLRERTVDIRRRRRRYLLRQCRRNDFRANGAADEVGWTADADRLYERPIPSLPMNLPPKELFHCRCLCRRLGREIPRAGCAHE